MARETLKPTMRFPLSGGGLDASLDDIAGYMEENLPVPESNGPPMVSQLIASLIGANMNATGDQQFTPAAGVAGNSFVVEYVFVTNASIPLDTASAAVFAEAGGTGDELYAAGNFSDLDAPSAFRTSFSNEFGLSGLLTSRFGHSLTTAPFLWVVTPQGAPATADWRIVGRILS